MKSTTSGALDLLRIICALVVFASHCALHWNQEASAILRPFAHQAVIVFFVISGYVITFSTMNRKRLTWQDYAVGRLSRLYSVIVPALVMTLALQLLGSRLAPDAYAEVSRGADAARYLFSALFLQNTWMLSAAPPTNAPLWSLSYEAWYYAAFGAAIFAPRGIVRLGWVALVCAAAGPNILLLAPAWLVGAALSRLRSTPRSRLDCAVVFCSGTVIMIAAATVLADLPQAMVGKPPLFFSASFISDGVFAIGVAMVISSFGVDGVELRETWVRRLRVLGDYTFPLYLLHFPLLFFFTAVTGFRATTWGAALPFALLILAIVLAISNLTERARPGWKTLFLRIFSGISAARARAA